MARIVFFFWFDKCMLYIYPLQVKRENEKLKRQLLAPLREGVEGESSSSRYQNNHEKCLRLYINAYVYTCWPLSESLHNAMPCSEFMSERPDSARNALVSFEDTLSWVFALALQDKSLQKYLHD